MNAPVDRLLLRALLHELDHQARFVDIAANDLEKWTSESRIDSPEATERVWYSVQSLLVGAANISKLLWGGTVDAVSPQPTGSARPENVIPQTVRERLQEIAGVTPSSTLRSRALRNIWEHFDRELAVWARQSGGLADLADSNMGPSRRVLGRDPRNLLRNLDYQEWVLTYRGKNLPLIPLLEEVVRVGELVAGEIDRMYGLS